MQANRSLSDIAVIGGGASGLMAAITAAEAPGGPRRVILLEKNDRVGKKLLATGNGRCNLTNLRAAQTAYWGRGAAFARALIGRFPPDETLRFFESCGVLPRVEGEGRVYPYSGQAASVLELLRARAQSAGVIELCKFEAAALTHEGALFQIDGPSGRVEARAVVVAGGGLAAPQLGAADCFGLLAPFGHKASPLLPALAPLQSEPGRLKALKGVRCHARVALLEGEKMLAAEEGELQFTETALSGICVFNLSRLAARGLTAGNLLALSVDLLPAFSMQEAAAMLLGRAAAMRALPLPLFLTGLFPKAVGQALLKEVTNLSHEKNVSALTKAQLSALAVRAKDWRFPIFGMAPWRQAQVTAGGLDPRAFDTATLESKRQPGLFACGELLDVDGPCGGFNLQWAWSSGRAAGLGAARAVCRLAGESPLRQGSNGAPKTSSS